MASLVSVIIPCYNQARFLAEAIESVLGQDYPDKEVIVINDGSPDNVREVASQFEGRIIYVEQENRGFSGARNAGIRSAGGSYVAFLDADDVYLPSALSTMISYLDSHADTTLVCGDSLLFNETGTIGLKSTRSGAPKNMANFRWETVGYCATSSTVIVRSSCFDKAGFFEETVKEGGEDWLMWVKLSLHFNMAYINRPLTRYRLHGSNATSDIERINRGNRVAAAYIVNSPSFHRYPSHFRARLLYYRFATAWRTEPRKTAFGYFFRALFTDPTQIPYGIAVAKKGIANTFLRRAGKS
jgi:glycosyltransferase involved in cell wall biosynthesis